MTPKMLGLSSSEEDEPLLPPPTDAVEFPLAMSLDRYLENTEREMILHALEENGWNRTRTALALGSISRTTLIGKMKRLGLFTNSRRGA